MSHTCALDPIPAIMVKYEKIANKKGATLPFSTAATLSWATLSVGGSTLCRINTNFCGSPKCAYIHDCSHCEKRGHHPAYRCPELYVKDYRDVLSTVKAKKEVPDDRVSISVTDSKYPYRPAKRGLTISDIHKATSHEPHRASEGPARHRHLLASVHLFYPRGGGG